MDKYMQRCEVLRLKYAKICNHRQLLEKKWIGEAKG